MDNLWDDTYAWALQFDEKMNEIIYKQMKEIDNEEEDEEHPKLRRRLEGRDIFHGRSMMVLSQVFQTNPILRLLKRPSDERCVYLTIIDRLLNIIDSHDKPLSKGETWDMVMALMLDQARVVNVKEFHKTQPVLRGVFSVEATEVPTSLTKHQNRHSGKMTWFRWGGKFEVEVQGFSWKEATIRDQTKKQVQYELEIPLPVEQNKYCKKRKSNWNRDTLAKKHGNFKKLNSTRRGKLHQHMMSQACESDL